MRVLEHDDRADAAVVPPRLGTGADGGGKDFMSALNPNALEVVTAYLEPGLAQAAPDQRFQFERHGYFCVDRDSTPEQLGFNRTATLKDTWAKISGRTN